MKVQSIFTSVTNFSLVATIAVFSTLLSFVLFNTLKAATANAAPAVIYHNAGAGYMIKVCKVWTPYGYVLRVGGNKPANTMGGYSLSASIHPSSNSSYTHRKTTTSWYMGTDSVLEIPAGGDSNWFKAYIEGPSFQANFQPIYLMYYVPYC